MKGIVLYKGKYGATMQYAEWLGRELQVPSMEADEISLEQIGTYDYIVIGSSVYLGKMLLRDWLRKNTAFLTKKKLFFFIVGATPVDEKEKTNEIIRNNVPAELRDGGNVFYLPGRMLKHNLTGMDLFILRMGAFLQKDKETRARMLQDFDLVKRENLDGIIRRVNAFRPDRNKQSFDLLAV